MVGNINLCPFVSFFILVNNTDRCSLKKGIAFLLIQNFYGNTHK